MKSASFLMLKNNMNYTIDKYAASQLSDKELSELNELIDSLENNEVTEAVNEWSETKVKYVGNSMIKHTNLKRTRPILAINIATGEETIYESFYLLNKALGVQHRDVKRIIDPTTGNKSAKGYTFKWLDVKYRIETTGRAIIAKNTTTGEEIEFNSQIEASQALNVHDSEISRIVNHKGRSVSKGYTFKYKGGEYPNARNKKNRKEKKNSYK